MNKYKTDIPKAKTMNKYQRKQSLSNALYIPLIRFTVNEKPPDVQYFQSNLEKYTYLTNCISLILSTLLAKQDKALMNEISDDK